jgi:hypothetical protein
MCFGWLLAASIYVPWLAAGCWLLGWAAAGLASSYSLQAQHLLVDMFPHRNQQIFMCTGTGSSHSKYIKSLNKSKK